MPKYALTAMDGENAGYAGAKNLPIKQGFSQLCDDMDQTGRPRVRRVRVRIWRLSLSMRQFG